MKITVELESQDYQKLQQLQKNLGKDIDTVLMLAIEEFYDRHRVAVGAKALEILQRNGFVGCLQGEGDLSVNYKQELDWGNKV
ncbi:MAG: hypothetical protein VKJ46_16600 [Leptolyngbyaceae bacterium]|nr:hypothetical protein [Leptolyngbyaceae bacterium]